MKFLGLWQNSLCNSDGSFLIRKITVYGFCLALCNEMWYDYDDQTTIYIRYNYSIRFHY